MVSGLQINRPEFQLIDWIRAQVRDRAPVTLGIGDDAALLAPPANGQFLVAIDMLMEQTHFTFPPATPRLAGRKSLAVNLSDIAAMAGRPTAAFVSVALPKERGIGFAREVHAGVIELADQYDVVIAGGDTNSWSGPLVISVTVIGEPLLVQPVCRSGAKPGDWLFVTGALGGSLPSGRHLTFSPRLNEVRQLVQLVEPHAMLDLSDGLAADLHHILKASSVGAIIDASQVPLTETALRSATPAAALMSGLSDGEDFELLFSVAADDGHRLMKSWESTTPITKIGEITTELGCWLRHQEGRIDPLPPIGWTHEFES